MEHEGFIKNIFPLIGEYKYNHELQDLFEDDCLINKDLISKMCDGLSMGGLSTQITEYLNHEDYFTALEDLQDAGLNGYIVVCEKPKRTWNSRLMVAFYCHEIQDVFDSFSKWCEE